MKTTIDLPEEILQRAKIAAAQRKTTLKELVILGLNHALSTPSDQEESERRERAERLITALQAKNEQPMRPLGRDEIHDR